MEENKTAVYLRLSKEDVDKEDAGDESASISNQRRLLLEYAKKNQFDVVKIYSDDNESGLYDDRPEFEQMIKDAHEGLFKIIICKSQSRFSRNVEHIEKYLYNEFIVLGIRFIGVADGVDTSLKSNKKAIQINGLINEWYCESISENVNAVFQSKMNSGLFIGSQAPYGYLKDPLDHNHLVVDTYASKIVKRIYGLYMDGNGKGTIASILSKEKILIPTLYKQKELGVNYSNAHLLEETNAWSYQTIHCILNNQVYCGDMIQHRSKKVSYKSKVKKSLPKEKWICVADTHEPIISRELYETVQKLQLQKFRGPVDYEKKGVFSGLIFCADCKKSMAKNYARHGEHEFMGYICKTYKTHGKQFCSNHKISYRDLAEVVLDSIHKEAIQILSKEDKEELNHFHPNDKKRTCENELERIAAQLRLLNEKKQKTFEYLLDETITTSVYQENIQRFDQQIVECNLQYQKLEKEMDNESDKIQKYLDWEKLFKDCINIEQLDRDVVLELIEKIYVHADGGITICYRFAGNKNESGQS